MNPPLTVSVIICAYNERRWDDLVEAVKSVQEQTTPPLETIVVIDHNPQMFARVKAELRGVIAEENHGPQGASSSRNSGSTVAKGNIIAFMDDDAVALPTWIERMLGGYENPAVLGIGGRIEPLWLANTPRWFPEEFYWVIGATYKGMPETDSPIRNVWSGNMSIRREIFDSIDGFRTEFGKVGARSEPEDTDFCIRVLQRWPQGMWLYKTDAVVKHKIPGSRTTWRYFVRRCYNEGLGKAHLASLVGASDGMASERQHAFAVLPKGILAGIVTTFSKGDGYGIVRSAAIVIGLGVASLGYLEGLIRARLAGRSRAELADKV